MIVRYFKPLSCILYTFFFLSGLSSARADPGLTDFDLVLGRYGNLSTIAGMSGGGQGKDVNDWRNTMEGGPGTNADLSRPHMAMADAAGNVYVADKQSHSILKIRTDGTITRVAGATPGGQNFGGYNLDEGVGTSVLLDNPNGLYTFPDGTTYILDLGNDRIRKLDPSGFLTTVVTDLAGISVGRGLWVSPDQETIYYTSGTRVRRSVAGAFPTTYVSGFANLGNIDVDLSGNLVVTDRGDHRVWQIKPDGSQMVIAGNGSVSGGGDGFLATSTGLNEVRGIAFDDFGGYFLCTHKGGDMWYVDSEGIIHLAISGAGSGERLFGDGLPLTANRFIEKISEPRAVALAPDGALLITTNDSGLVRRVENIIPPREPSQVTVRYEDPRGAILQWQGDRRVLYRVECSADLAGDWKIGEPVLGHAQDGLTEFLHPEARGKPRMFYRIRAFK